LSKLIPPLSEPLLDRVKYELEHSNLSLKDSQWFTSLLVRSDFFNQQIDENSDEEQFERLSHWINAIKFSFKSHSRDTAHVEILSVASNFGPGYFGEHLRAKTRSLDGKYPAWLPDWFSEDLGVKWGIGFIELLECSNPNPAGPWNSKDFLNYLLDLPYFVPRLRIEFFAAAIAKVEIDTVIEALDQNRTNFKEFADPHRLEYWLGKDCATALTAFKPYLLAQNESRFGLVSLAIFKLIERTFWASTHESFGIKCDITRIREVLHDYFQIIEIRRKHYPTDLAIQKAFWKFIQSKYSFPFYGQVEGFQYDRVGKGYLKEAQVLLGRLCKDININTYICWNGRFDRGLYDSLINLIKDELGNWSAMKSLLITFSQLEKQGVLADLRYWNEEDSQPPEDPEGWVAPWIAGLIHSLTVEQASDPNLKGIRRSFAEYCLDRLRTRDTCTDSSESDADLIQEEYFVEPRGVWREAYARALTELKINPKGKGHHLLHWLRSHDPNQDVRDAAKAAYEVLRHNPSWPENLSPRRSLFGAFWWLRQAHLAHLNLEIDQRGAQRTRSKEITWTTKN